MRLTDETCVAIAKHCTTLTHLNLSGLTITNASLNALSTSSAIMARLRHLDVSFCVNLTASGLIALLTCELKQSFQQNGRHDHSICSREGVRETPLRSLTFFAAKMDVFLATDESISLLASCAASSLKTLMLNKCLNLTGMSPQELIDTSLLTFSLLLSLADEAVAAIGKHCPNLTTLNLSSCNLLVRTSLARLHLPFSHEFPFQTDASLNSLAAGTPLLTTLEIASCSQLTDSELPCCSRDLALIP